MIQVAGERGWLVYTEWIIPFPWFLKSSFAEVTFWCTFTCDANIFSFSSALPIQGGLSTLPLPRLVYHQFSNIYLPSPWLSSQNICHSLWITHLATSPSKKNEKAGTLLEVLPSGRVLQDYILYHCPLGMSQEGSVVLSLPIWGWCLHFVQKHLKTVLSLFFLCQLIVGNSHWALAAVWEREREGNAPGVGTISIWVTSSGNLYI